MAHLRLTLEGDHLLVTRPWSRRPPNTQTCKSLEWYHRTLDEYCHPRYVVFNHLGRLRGGEGRGRTNRRVGTNTDYVMHPKPGRLSKPFFSGIVSKGGIEVSSIFTFDLSNFSSKPKKNN